MTVGSDGKAIHVSSFIPGRAEISYLDLLANSECMNLDEGYYELIVSKRKPTREELSQKDEETNSKLHLDKVLVEDFFGRLKVMFGILASPYRCALNTLEDVVITCICLLNPKLKRQPLRSVIANSKVDGATGYVYNGGFSSEDSE